MVPNKYGDKVTINQRPDKVTNTNIVSRMAWSYE